MSDLGCALGGKGPGQSVAVNGKAYTASHLTQRKKAEFSRWMKDQALAMLVESRGSLPPDVWEREFRQHKRDVATGVYDYHSPLCQEALATPAGSLALACVLFGVAEDEMVAMLRDGRDAVEAALAVVMAESMPRPQGEGEGGEGNGGTPA